MAREWEVEPAALAEELRAGKRVRLIDVREPHELEISRLEGAELIPLGTLASRLHELDSAQELVVFCKTGSRSARAVELLAGAGFRKVRNLYGGINAWARVDPSCAVLTIGHSPRIPSMPTHRLEKGMHCG
jgi:adenylyltransferase/sulfurtransferase